MFGSAILDVAVGLIFVYFLLSVIASHIDEFIAEKAKWRANDLANAIRGMLAHPEVVLPGHPKGLADSVLGHSLITGLRTDRISGDKVEAGRAPSYIPARTFALALLDAIAPSPRGSTEPQLFIDVRKQIVELPDALPQRRILLAFLDSSEGKLDRARAGIEDWFNGAMDRVSGAYRRRLMWVNLGVALLIASVLGVDTIAVANALWHDQAIRDAVAAAAGAQQQATPPFAQAVATLDQYNLPLAWKTFPTDLPTWLLKIAGILLTAGAVSLGAPFWFDLLKNISNLRSSGPAPVVQPPKTETAPSPEPAQPSDTRVLSLLLDRIGEQARTTPSSDGMTPPPDKKDAMR